MDSNKNGHLLRRKPIVSFLFAGLAGCFAIAMASRTASAATIKVEGLCSLQAAIDNYNARKQLLNFCGAGTGDDTIILANGTVDVVVPLPAIGPGKLEITNQGGNCTELVIDSYLTVNAGADVTLQGVGIEPESLTTHSSLITNNGGRVTLEPSSNENICTFTDAMSLGTTVSKGGIIYNGGGTVNLEGASMRDTHVSLAGGGIYNDRGTVNIIGPGFTEIRRNSSDNGGGIFNSAGTVAINTGNYKIDGNTTPFGGAGGGLYNDLGTLTITRDPGTATKDLQPNGSGFINNKADFGGAFFSEGGKVELSRLSFTDNTAYDQGGAVYIEHIPNTVRIDNAYFSGNLAFGHGGAIFATALSSDTTGYELDIAGSTFANNVARLDPVASIYDHTSLLYIVNSTFAGASGPEGILVASSRVANIAFSTFANAGLVANGDLEVATSILSQVTCEGKINQVPNNSKYDIPFDNNCPGGIKGGDPIPSNMEGRIPANNGGPTPTIIPLNGSTAVDAVPNNLCVGLDGNPLTVDERGYPRPDVGDPSNGPCDVGAVETGY